MDISKRYGMIVTAEDAAFYLLKRTLFNASQQIGIARATANTPPATAAFILSGLRVAVPMSAAVRIAYEAQSGGTEIAKAIHAAAAAKVTNPEMEYRATLEEIDRILEKTGNSDQMVRGLYVLRGSIATRLTVTTFSIAA